MSNFTFDLGPTQEHKSWVRCQRGAALPLLYQLWLEFDLWGWVRKDSGWKRPSESWMSCASFLQPRRTWAWSSLCSWAQSEGWAAAGWERGRLGGSVWGRQKVGIPPGWGERSRSALRLGLTSPQLPGSKISTDVHTAGFRCWTERRRSMYTCFCTYQFTLRGKESNRVIYVKPLYEGSDQENTMSSGCTFRRFIKGSNTINSFFLWMSPMHVWHIFLSYVGLFGTLIFTDDALLRHQNITAFICYFCTCYVKIKDWMTEFALIIIIPWFNLSSDKH